VTEEALFTGLGSPVALANCTLLLNVPVAVGLTTTVLVTLAPFARVPRLQVTLPLAKVQPAVVETKVIPAGRVSVRVTAEAGFGPLFLAVTI
jgi:hypothetical protein